MDVGLFLNNMPTCVCTGWLKLGNLQPYSLFILLSANSENYLEIRIFLLFMNEFVFYGHIN